MCEFCESKKLILHYDNRATMRVSYGQYQGVMINSNLYMEGNMLSLEGDGSYRSESDCYYEDEGLEIDNKNAAKNTRSIIKMSYCPFCGRKLDKGTYETTNAQNRLSELNEAIEVCKDILHQQYNTGIFFFTRTNVPHDDGWQTAVPNENDTLKLAINVDCPALSVKTTEHVNDIYYDYVRTYLKNIQPFDENYKTNTYYADCNWYGTVVYSSNICYYLSDERILRLIEDGLIVNVDDHNKKVTVKKYKEIMKSREHVKSLLTQFLSEKEECEKTIAQYENNRGN